MAHRVMLCIIYASGVFQEGLAALIQTQPAAAALGEEARLHCLLLQPKRVEQVTWWKLLPGGEINLASYTKEFGERVNPDFRGNVKIEVPDLQNISIIMRSVMVQDGGCYKCLFNTLPEGAFIATTCLTVYELHEPILQLESSSSEELVVTCSATGRPVPTVTLSVPGGEAVSVNNANGTVTVTRTAVLSGFHDNCTQVECATQVFAVPPRKMFMKLPEVKQPTDEDFKESNGSYSIIVIAATSAVVCFVISIIFVIAIMVVVIKRPKRRNSLSHRDSEKSTSPQRPLHPTQQHKTPENPPGSEQARKRTSSEKRRENDRSKASSCLLGHIRQLNF